MSKISKVPLSIRFFNWQLDEAQKYLDKQDKEISYSELVRLSLTHYLRVKAMEQESNKSSW